MPKHEMGFSFRVRYEENGEVKVLHDPRPELVDTVHKLQSMSSGPERDELARALNRHYKQQKHSRPFIRLDWY